MPSSTVENYIKAIFSEQQDLDGLPVTMGRIADCMLVVPGTATTMVKALAEAGWVDYEPRKGVRLTPAGEKLALDVLRRHRLIELFLQKILGMDWSEIHQEAEELEHAISPRVLAKIDQMLGHPRFDPHGDPIPTADGDYPTQMLKSLNSCALNTWVTIARIKDQEPSFLQYAESRGLLPGATVRVMERDLLAESVSIEVKGGEKLALGIAVARKIGVDA
jgi:DtxR family Mn-dependent transcriptional regulator